MTTPLVPSDLARVVLISDPQISPDGSAVYYRRSWFDGDADEVRGAIHRLDRDGADRAFTAGTNDRSARIAPDGKAVAFVSERDGQARVHLLRLDGGEAIPLGEGYPKITALVWSPDGKRLAFVAMAAHDPATARVFHDEKTGARHIRMLPFKSDADGLLDGARKHLFVIDAAGGEARRVTARRLRREHAGVVARREAHRVLLAHRPAGGGDRAERHLCIVPVDERHADALTSRYRPDGARRRGRTTAKRSRSSATMHGDDGGGRFDTELLVAPAEGGATRSLSAGLGRTVGDCLAGDLRSGAALAPVWGDGDREIFMQVSDDGSTSLRAFARDGKRHARRRGRRAPRLRLLDRRRRHDRDRLWHADGTERDRADRTVRRRTRLTDANPWLAEKDVAAPERYRPRADDGALLDGWLIRPKRSREAVAAARARSARRPARRVRRTRSSSSSRSWPRKGSRSRTATRAARSRTATPTPTRSPVTGAGSTPPTYCASSTARSRSGRSTRAHRPRRRFVRRLHDDLAAGPQRSLRRRRLDARGQRFRQRARRVRSRLVPRARVERTYADDAGASCSKARRCAPRRDIDAPLLVEHSERDYRCPIDKANSCSRCCAGWARPTPSSCASRRPATSSRAAASRAAASCACARSRTGSSVT
jgi:hypothetical protein